MKKSIWVSFATAVVCASTPFSTFAADSAIALAAHYENGSTGVGTGANKKVALKLAKAACKKEGGEQCYSYWTLPSSHAVIVQCNFELGTKADGEFFIQGGHSETNLKAARALAFKNLKKGVNYYGLSVTSKNCFDVISYSNGKFKKH